MCELDQARRHLRECQQHLRWHRQLLSGYVWEQFVPSKQYIDAELSVKAALSYVWEQQEAARDDVDPAYLDDDFYGPCPCFPKFHTPEDNNDSIIVGPCSCFP